MTPDPWVEKLKRRERLAAAMREAERMMEYGVELYGPQIDVVVTIPPTGPFNVAIKRREPGQ